MVCGAICSTYTVALKNVLQFWVWCLAVRIEISLRSTLIARTPVRYNVQHVHIPVIIFEKRFKSILKNLKKTICMIHTSSKVVKVNLEQLLRTVASLSIQVVSMPNESLESEYHLSFKESIGGNMDTHQF